MTTEQADDIILELRRIATALTNLDEKGLVMWIGEQQIEEN